ncbi:MAG: hypothetical protein M1816_001336 [Peltula sp. TS41687]|nr:MAG: hypothetical protein M1816_001336 [Peltula sp. TS41687]
MSCGIALKKHFTDEERRFRTLLPIDPTHIYQEYDSENPEILRRDRAGGLIRTHYSVHLSVRLDLFTLCRYGDLNTAESAQANHGHVTAAARSMTAWVRAMSKISSCSQTIRAVYTLLHTIGVTGLQTWLVFDECHVIVKDAGWRQCMASLTDLVKFPCQRVLITATLPPYLHASLVSDMALPPASTITIRAPTNRDSIAYSVRIIGPEECYVVQNLLWLVASLEIYHSG